MLPIISSKKQAAEKKIKKRPRAVLPPSKSTSKKAPSISSSTNNVDRIVVGKEISGHRSHQQQQQSHLQAQPPLHQGSNNEENALILAAEAAAALIMGNNNDYMVHGDEAAATNTIAATSTTTHNSTSNNSTSLELLENVVAGVKVVQGSEGGGGGGGTAWGGNNSDNYHYQNPLGPSSQVQTFQSKVPTMLTSSSLLEMSEAQREFLTQYYGSGCADDRDNDLDRNGVDEDEEIIEEDGDDTADGSNNYHNKKMGMEVTEPSSSGGTLATMTTTATGTAPTTLRAMCQKIPRSTSTNKKKKMKKTNDKEKKGVTFHEGGDVVHLFKKDEEENSVGEADGDASTSTTSPTLAIEDHAAVLSGPQVTVDEHGTIVIAQDSLLPNPENRQSTSDIDQELLGGGSVIDEGETPSQLGAIQARYDSFTAVPRTVPVRWSVRETKDFYNALRQCGTDFSLMQMYCLGRTRAQLKRKFKVESRKNARLVDMALDPKCQLKLGKFWECHAKGFIRPILIYPAHITSPLFMMVDISVFGDSLEIPEEVPTFVREVTPPTLPATGGAAAAPPAAAESNVHHGMNRNYDHLFEEEDGDLPMSDNSTAACAGGAATGVGNDTTKLAPADNFASNFQTVQGRDALQHPPTILPVVVTAPQATGKKKTRFKVKPSKGKATTKSGK